MSVKDPNTRLQLEFKKKKEKLWNYFKYSRRLCGIHRTKKKPNRYSRSQSHCFARKLQIKLKLKSLPEEWREAHTHIATLPFLLLPPEPTLLLSA